MSTRASMSLLFFVRKTRVLKSGEVSVQLRITVSGKSSEVSIGMNVKPELWSDVSCKAMGTTKKAKIINSHIDHIQSEVYEHYRILALEDKDITAIAIKNAWLGIEEKPIMLVEVFQEHNDNVKKLIGIDFAQATHQRYETTLSHIKELLIDVYGEKDIPINNVDYKFIAELELHLKTKRKCCHNTATKYIKNFKKIIRIAKANDWIKLDPFANHKFKLQKVDRGYLTESEIETIKNKDIAIERLNIVRDAFLFACYTGLAYSDLKKLAPNNLIEKGNGSIWVYTKRTKTGTECHIPLIGAALLLLKKYQKHPYCIENKVLLPIYSNQKTNAYLKEIGTICGIDKNLSSHLARHTFATTITLNNNVPIETVSKMLGHSSINMTKIYARLLDKKVENDMAQLMDKY
ncbi:MAG: site-specific integrase [Bacteroidales bacterium]|nr:site-specific integrase [Bacteroidales bacterium]